MLVFWVLFVVAAVLLVFAMLKIERRRSETHAKEYQAAASKIGAFYAYDAPDALVSKLKGFDLTYSNGHRLPDTVRDVFSQRDSTAELHVFLHEHRGNRPGGAGATWHRETVGCVVSPLLQLPRFRLSPERPVEKIASMLGIRDVDFDSHPGFSKLYFLNAKDEMAVRSLFDSEVLNFFENHPGFHVEGSGDTLVVYRFGRTVSLEELPDFFRSVREISGLFRR